jgi:epoxyqueuosine reductase
MTDSSRLSRSIKEEARRLGFDLLGITSPETSGHLAFLEEWLDLHYHGEMHYLEREDSLQRRADLRRTQESVRTVLVVGHDYYQEDPPGVPEDPSRGVVARYARGEDYHLVMKSRLEELRTWLEGEVGEPVEGRAYVDTGPILERELGQRAGLGWLGKNTMLIHPRRGSYFFLGILLLDLDLPTDPPFAADRCGSCVACLDACPTGALLGRNADGAPVMNARRCISYLTIELKGPIPRELRSSIGNRIFGCDICQEVCPWNRKFAEPSAEPAYRAGPDTDGPALVALMGLTEDDFAARFSGSPVKRTKRRGLLRNVAVALGNWGAPEAVPVLIAALEDSEPLVRGHAAWALGEILGRAGIPGDGGFEVAEALLFRLHEEEDPWVEEELEAALRG